jgi:hypothetical protein
MFLQSVLEGRSSWLLLVGSAKGNRRPWLSFESGESLPLKSVRVRGRAPRLSRPKLLLLDKNPEKLLRPVTSSLMVLAEALPAVLLDDAV